MQLVVIDAAVEALPNARWRPAEDSVDDVGVDALAPQRMSKRSSGRGEPGGRRRHAARARSFGKRSFTFRILPPRPRTDPFFDGWRSTQRDGVTDGSVQFSTD